MIDRLGLFWRCAKCGLDQLGPVSDLPEPALTKSNYPSDKRLIERTTTRQYVLGFFTQCGGIAAFARKPR